MAAIKLVMTCTCGRTAEGDVGADEDNVAYTVGPEGWHVDLFFGEVKCPDYPNCLTTQ
jgi:hypothetical protein